MNRQLATAELEKKTIEELGAMLADDTLLPLDDPSNTDKILEILRIIDRKKNKPSAQREAERIAFWTSMLDRYGDQLPFRLEDVTRPRAYKKFSGDPNPQAGRTRFGRRLSWHRIVRRFATVAALVMALLLVNTLVAYAFQVNFLSAVVTFTDDLFRKTAVVSTVDVDTPESAESPQVDHTDIYNPLQAALDDMGITQPHAPGWLPDGFVFDGLQTANMQNNKIITVQYKRGEEMIMLTLFLYNQSSTMLTRNFEKSAGTPLEYERNGIVHYIFNNLDMTVATWLDGLYDCDIQGKISVEEMKSIIDSMY